MELLIQTIRKYIPFSSADEMVAQRLFYQKKYKKGDHLLAEGEICRNIFFIESGLVRYYINKDGEEQTNYFNKEGEFVCVYTSFLPQGPSTINIQALEDCSVWMITFEGIQQFYKEVKFGERFGRLAIETVFVSAIAQIASFYTDAPEVRYQKFLLDYPAIVQRIPQYYIASYVGVKPQSLSRIRKRLSSSK
ncbi:MAG: Crp/Fnr family transcriptional regulator [Sphingobacteriales bacterium 50-39]|nr:MAG: Crp/Fnr family transcriptional regulator [Sphingobacteriales bacterium 50-39]